MTIVDTWQQKGPTTGNLHEQGADSPTVGRRPTRPRVEVVLTALALATMPLLVPAGPGNTGMPDVWIVSAILATALWASRGRIALRLPYALPIAIAILAGALAGLTANAPARTVLPLFQDVLVLLWAAVIVNICRSEQVLRTLLKVWAWTGVVWAALMVFGVLTGMQGLAGVSARDGSRAALTFGDANLAANYFVITLLIVRACRFPRARAPRLAACGVLLLAIAFTGSNGAAVALIAATAIGAVLGVRRRAGTAVALGLAAALISVAGVLAATVSVADLRTQAQDSGIPQLRDSVGRSDESVGSRGDLARETWHLWLNGKVLGVGPARTKEALRSNQSTYVKEAHDDYMAALAERGPLGLTAIVLLLAVIVIRLTRLTTRPLAPAFAEVVPRPELLAGAVVAFLLSGFFYEVLHFRHVWALLGLVAALDIWGRDRTGPGPGGRR